MKVALLQWDIRWEKKQKNFDTVERMIEEAKEREPDLVVLPEMFATGFTMRSEDHAENAGGETSCFLHEMARKHRIYIVGGLIERGIEKPRNTAIAFDPEGERLGKYYKIHPFTLQGEPRYYEPGEKVVLFDMAGFRTAIFICFDLRFPELFRYSAFNGASLFIVPANWPTGRIHHWKTLLTARAIENQAFVVGVNRIGTSSEELSYPGQSMVVDPRGKILAEAPDREGITWASIDAGEVEKVRKDYPFLEDARQDLYGNLYRPRILPGAESSEEAVIEPRVENRWRF